jgi:hypothetical protein
MYYENLIIILRLSSRTPVVSLFAYNKVEDF